MDTSQAPPPPRPPYEPLPYERPDRYDMAGGSGFPVPGPGPEPSSSHQQQQHQQQPWQPSPNPPPGGHDTGAWPPPPDAEYPRPVQDNPMPQYGPAPYPGPPGPPGPQGELHNVGHQSNPSLEHMPGPAGMPQYQQPEPGIAPVVLPHTQSGLSAPMAMTPQDVKSAKASCHNALAEYLLLQKKRQSLDQSADLDQQLRDQAGRVLADLRTLRNEVSTLIEDAQGSRWRKWLIGGAVAAFFPILHRIIPAVRSIFRRSSEEKSEDKTVTDTEHAFARSKEILSRIKDSVFGKGGFATMTFLVFGVLYIFSNEVSIIVAKTMSKRLKRLTTKLERGDDQVTEKDLKVLEGWRWRVLLWS